MKCLNLFSGENKKKNGDVALNVTSCFLGKEKYFKMSSAEFLYAYLKNETYYVTGSSVCPYTFSFPANPTYSTSDEAETWFIVKP